MQFCNIVKINKRPISQDTLRYFTFYSIGLIIDSMKAISSSVRPYLA